VAMNKYFCKMYLQGHGIPVLPSVLVRRQEAQRNLTQIHEKIFATKGFEKFPLFVKPCHLGSSIAINKATDIPTLNAALAAVFRYDDEALIEPCITELLEINVSVLDGNPPIASVVEIPIASSGALTYEDKYLRGGNKSAGGSAGMASLTRVIDPKDLAVDIKQLVINYALEGYRALGCSGVSRFDFMIDLATDKLYFNEINPIPGSLAFYLWAKSAPPILYTELLERMIDKAVQRKGEKLSLQRDFGFKALK
jgi:D-alanine-D-alanine ligase